MDIENNRMLRKQKLAEILKYMNLRKYQYIFIFILFFPALIYCSDRFFFDDFSYYSINVPNSIDSAAGSIFGYNDWIFSDGRKKTKGWYRWNIGEPDYDSLCGIELKNYGFDLYCRAGTNPKKPHSFLPTIHSSFRFKHGTFASRVRFPNHYHNDFSNFAYWLFSPISFIFFNGKERIQYASEMDFEWNNWFKVKNDNNMTIGCNNHNYKYPIQFALRLSVFENSKKLSINRFDDKIRNNDIFFNQWFICIFVIDTINQITKIYMNSDYDSLPGIRTFGGLDVNSADEFKPFQINNYTPDYDMAIFYTIGLSDLVSNDNRMGVDWTFYSPDIDLSFEEITATVNQLKSNGISRLNSVDAPVYIHAGSSRIIDCFLNGPDSVLHGTDAEWMLDTKYLRWSAYEVELSYRMFHKENGWGSWTNYFSNKLRFNSACIYDSLEFNVELKDQYRDIYGTVNKKIHFVRNPNCFDFPDSKVHLLLYPNPVLTTLCITQLDSGWNHIPSIQIISLLGVKFYDSPFSSIIDVGFLPPGVYLIKVKNQYFPFIKI